MPLDAATALYGVWGHPVGHSFSPLIHNRALALDGINAAYLAFDVHPQDLTTAVEGARALRMRGWNVTIPHKQAIVPLLDMVDEQAARIGAVNTVRFREGRLEGHNTDGIGFLGPLRERLGFAAEDAVVVILGAGGSARAIAFALAAAGAAEIHLVNRTRDRAEELAKVVHEAYGFCTTTAHELHEPVALPALADADLIVQTTSRGLEGDAPVAVDWTACHTGAIAADIVYGREPGAWLAAAAGAGLRTHEGLWMLLGQAQAAYRLWTGRSFGLEKAYGWVHEALAARAAAEPPA